MPLAVGFVFLLCFTCIIHSVRLQSVCRFRSLSTFFIIIIVKEEEAGDHCPRTVLNTSESQSFNYVQGKTDTETNYEICLCVHFALCVNKYIKQYASKRTVSLVDHWYTYTRTDTRARAHTHTHTHTHFLCIVLAAAYLKYRRCCLSCLPFVWHFFSL